MIYDKKYYFGIIRITYNLTYITIFDFFRKLLTYIKHCFFYLKNFINR